MSRLICRCGKPIPRDRARSEHCSPECEHRETRRLAAEAQHQLAENNQHESFDRWMQAWRERVDREVITAVIGLNPDTVARLSKPDELDDLRVRVHFIDGTHTDFKLTGDQFTAAVRYTSDAIKAMNNNWRAI